MTSMPRLLLAAACFLLPLAPGAGAGTPDEGAALPRLLQDTGLYAAGSVTQVRPGIVSFSPQYPLWSDGAEKSRWMYLPPGAFVDASRPDAWEFPRGTKLWKEFAHEGTRVETRYIERVPDGSWRFATYIWNEAGTEAVLAPARGIAALPVRAAPQGRYAVPARTDCIACHGSNAVPVLGLSALQLSPDRDPFAVHGRPLRTGELDLRALVARGQVRGLPRHMTEQPPRIHATTPVERAALGYLQGNCAHCHNTSGNRVPLPLTLAQRAGDPAVARAEVLRTTIGAASRYRSPEGEGPSVVVAPGDPNNSLLAVRMQSRHAQAQMPPLGTSVPDTEGLALIHRWITSIDSSNRKETAP